MMPALAITITAIGLVAFAASFAMWIGAAPFPRDEAPMNEDRETLLALLTGARLALLGMLAHSCVADAGSDMKDEEDDAAERLARLALSRIDTALAAEPEARG